MASHALHFQAKSLAERVAVITASTKGIGFAIAKRLGNEGAYVVVSSRKQKNVDEAVRALRFEGVVCEGTTAHVGVAAERKKLIDFALNKFGKLDILVSNAAVNPAYSDLIHTTESQWDKLLDLNVKSAFLLSQEAVPHLEKSGNGNIVFVSSIAAYQPIDGIGAYSIMKTALVGLSKSLAQTLADKNIRVNAIAPGVIRTEFSKQLTDGAAKMDPAAIPLGRFGEADDCAGAVSFLVSNDAAYLQGEIISVNGGMPARI